MKTRIPFYQVDAFTEEPFSGNPAAVCFPEHWLPDDVMQAIAAENNLSETAFVVSTGSTFQLRWFTPVTEVDLCGHATLAAATVLFEKGIVKDVVSFQSRSGELAVRQSEAGYGMDFPACSASPVELPPGLPAALGLAPELVMAVMQAADIVVVIRDESALDRLEPDFDALRAFNTRGVMVTAAASSCDFRSRWFGPRVGVNEDPVTGSAHTFVAPYWSGVLGKTRLLARQGGKRQGVVQCEIHGNGRITLAGKSDIVIEGNLLLP